MFNYDTLLNSEMKDKIIKDNLLNFLPDPLFILDQKGKILDCFVGRPGDLIIPKDNLIGENINNFLSEKKSKEAIEILDYLINHEDNKKYYKFNFIFERNAEKHYYESRLVPYLDDKILALVRNISEIKKTEQELKKQKELYQKIFNLAPVGILIGDEDANIIDVNKNLAEINKVAPEDLIGTNVFDSLVDPENIEISKNNLKRIFKGETINSEIKDKDSQGNDIFINIIETAINLEGNKQGYISLQTDITERKRREAILEFNQYLIENAAIAILRISYEGVIQNINQKTVDLLGYSKDQLIGKKISYIATELEEKDLKEDWKAIKKNKITKIETEVLTSDKQRLPVEVTSHYINYKGKEYEIAYLQDISDRITAEEKLIEQKNIIKKLHQTALRLSQSDNEENILINTIEAAENILDFNICDISLVEDDKVITEITSDAVAVHKDLTIPVTEGLAGKTYRQKKKFLVNDLNKDQDARPVSSDFQSAISIPIKDFGVFQAVATERNAFTKEDLELAEILISHMATALEQVRYKEEIEYKSFYDELTDTYNRRFFEEELVRMDTKRQLPISIIMSDLNGLKIINDSHGHEIGDKLLKEAANIIKSALRTEDILARFGGDEFAILLPATEKKEAEMIVERIKNKCKQTMGKKLPISLGIGVATKEDLEEEITQTLQRADNNMYQNKLLASRSTKNKIVTSLLNTLRAKSDETEEHSERMIELAQKLGKKLGLSGSELNKLSLLASLHDIGKTSISEEILNKPESLTEDECGIIQEHPERGYRIATATEEFSIIAREILCHHEH
ncbi:MAG: PAS domain S-box protein, partial [Bacillota bacterium]